MNHDTRTAPPQELPLWQNARRTDPDTSKAAAASLGDMDTLFAVLLEAYRNAPGGLTDEEAASLSGITYDQSRKRCSDLRRDGKIVPTGAVRIGSSGRAQRVCAVA